MTKFKKLMLAVDIVFLCYIGYRFSLSYQGSDAFYAWLCALVYCFDVICRRLKWVS